VMAKPPKAVLSELIIKRAVEEALREDLGALGDITTNATIAETAKCKARFVARVAGVISGIDVARLTFAALDDAVTFEAEIADGDPVKPKTVVASVTGHARAILTGERVALNFMGRMSGIASLTRKYADAIEGTAAKIADTRKTTPGLRAFEKYAVRCGGGVNHRVGLFDAILIKDNHIVAAGGIKQAIERAHAYAGHMVKIEIEVDTLKQLEKVLAYKIDAVLLDNMTPETLHQAVKMVGGRALCEASGGVNLQTVRAIAETGVDLISVGALTHSAPVLDLGLDFEG
jgi:nicotinate-nucleotide pyrophosphorylase (carboxylating)